MEARQRSAAANAVITVGLCFLAAMFEGFDLQAAGVAAPRLGPALRLNSAELGLFFSVATFGLLFGSALGGWLSDFVGRKRVLIGSLVAFGLMSLANGLAPSFGALIGFRFLTGVGLGGAFPSLLALAAEATPHGRRATAVSVLYAGMPFGGALASLVSLAGGIGDWRTVFFAGGLAPVILAPLLIFVLPESGELQAARAEAAASGRRRGGFASHGRGFATLLLWIACFLALVAMYILLNWLPTLLVGRGLSRAGASWVQMAFNLAMVAGSVVTGLAMDRIALSKAVFAAFASATMALAILWQAPVSLAISLLVGVLVGATVASTQALLYAVAPATYPAEVRGAGVGGAVAAGRVGAGLGPLFVAVLLGSGTLPQTTVMVLIPTIVSSGAAALWLSLLIERRPRLAIATP